jgi:multidrug efflux pump subunit AcrB
MHGRFAQGRPTIFPEIRIPVVTVIWLYTGQSTPEIEQSVTTYSELR